MDSIIEKGKDNNQSLINSIANQIFVTFKTNLPEQYQLDENTISVSSGYTDRDLNKLLNRLLQTEKDLEDANYNFEFLLNNDFIKGTLKSHIIKHQLISEKTLEIYYCFALEKPKLSKIIEEEDWVWTISKFEGLSDERNYYGVGHFNGTISIYNQNDQKLSNVQIVEDGSIKALKIVTNTANKDQESYFVITGSNTEEINISRLNVTKKGMRLNKVYLGKSHSGSVESIDINPLNSSQFASGGADATLKIWKFDHHVDEANGQEKSNKKIKIQEKEISPTSSIPAHADEISRVLWIKPETVLTGSQDHTIRFIDLTKHQERSIIDCKDNVVTSLSYANNLIISGHEDAYVKVWDERSENKQPIKILKAHNKWISDIKFHPNNSTLFLTGSYDSSVKLWDFRSAFPLVTLKDQKDKIFTVEWNGDSNFLSGGSDAKIVSYEFQNQ